MSGIAFKGNKLVGRSNYIESLTNASLFFEINGFILYINGTETPPDYDLYYKDSGIAYSRELVVKYSECQAKYIRNNTRALGTIKSTISIENTKRFKDKTTTKELFSAIKATFGESSLEMIGRYLDRILVAQYGSFKSMDEYTSQIQSATIYLSELKNTIPKPFLAWIIFKGLPSQFDSFISRKYEELAKDLDNIDISKLVADLISEEARLNSGLEANKTSINKGSFCRHCKKKGHIESRYFTKYPELRPNSKDKPKNKDKNKDKANNKATTTSSTSTSSSKPTSVIMSAFTDVDQFDLNYSNLSDNDGLNLSIALNKNKLVLDSGATEHFTPNKDWLVNYQKVYNKSITVANGKRLAIEGTGDIPAIANGRNIIIKNVNYIPEIKATLISSKELTNNGWSILFKDAKVIISHLIAKMVIIANWAFNAYYIDNINIDFDTLEPVIYQVKSVQDKSELDLYHKRLLHINKDYILKTITSVNGLRQISDSNSGLNHCDSCYSGKFTHTYSHEPLKSNTIFDIIDIDVAGPFNTISIKGERYFMTITDRASRAIWVYPLKFKSEVLEVLVSFYNLIIAQFKTNIKAIRLDNAKEFRSNKWTLFTTNKGIICEYTSPYTPN